MDKTNKMHQKKLKGYLHKQYIENSYMPKECRDRFKHRPYDHMKEIKSNEMGVD